MPSWPFNYFRAGSNLLRCIAMVPPFRAKDFQPPRGYHALFRAGDGAPPRKRLRSMHLKWSTSYSGKDCLSRPVAL